MAAVPQDQYSLEANPCAVDQVAVGDLQRPDVDGAAIQQLHDEFGNDWAITVESGRLVAVHRREGYDARRERWVIRTTVEAATVERLHTRLTIQQAVRGAENR